MSLDKPLISDDPEYSRCLATVKRAKDELAAGKAITNPDRVKKAARYIQEAEQEAREAAAMVRDLAAGEPLVSSKKRSRR